jgi:hypothetical protein
MPGPVGGRERHHAAAEAAAGHPGARRAGLDGGLNGLVGLGPGHLELVPKRAVRGGQQRAQGRLVACAQQFGGPQDAAGLGDDVPVHALQGRLAQAGQFPGRASGIPQRPHAQRGRGVLAGPAAFGVPAVSQRPAGPGVDDQQRQADGGRVERNLRPGAAAAVQQERVAGPAPQRGDLVHDPGGHADELGLGAPGQGGQFTPRHGHLVDAGQRERHRALQRRRGRQPGARGQIGVDRHVGPAGQVTGLAQRPGHPGRVGGPASHRAWFECDRGQHDRLAVGPPRPQRDPPVRPPGGSHADSGGERERQHEHLGVIRAADQVDPARREPDALRLPAIASGQPPAGIRRAGPVHAALHCAAACCGSTGSKKTPAPSSAAPKCRSTPGARSAGARCRCRCAAGHSPPSVGR